ncbi:ATP-binding protein [Nocardioides panacis]|uniref:ATP-binding protein n=1 Tax=Nocardioides panacis TaxID=2849501 RepID=A0A975T2Y6_9ACTN|nr:ATP-binding protein [Nocardioides panacis]QWZ09924.1 ATP-binding protein [Nocardioides panacis]
MSDRTPWSHDIDLDDRSASASRARAFVRRRLEEHCLSPLGDDVQVVVSELVTNAVRHARTPVTVTLHAFDLTLLLEVQDGSAVRPARGAAPDVLATHGRGLHIVGILSRDWGTDALPDGGKSVWAEFGLPERRIPGGRATA